jgi:hypothetical protein
MSAVCNEPDALSDIAVKDTNRLIGRIAECLAQNAVFVNILDGGTFPSGVSDTVRSAVSMPAAPGDSMAIPTFVEDLQVCGTDGIQDLTGTVDFSYSLKTKRGKGPRVCMKKGYAAFRDSYLQAENSLAKLVTQYINADVRAQLYLNSASKFNATAGYCFEDLFTGGQPTDIGVQFAQVLPTGPVSFKAILTLNRFMREALLAEPFPGDGKGQPHAKVIGSADIIDAFREESDVHANMMALTTGGYQIGENTLTAYSWETSPAYRGIAFGTDQTPLRATGFDQNGDLALVNPRLTVADPVKNTAYSIVNPAWLAAPYEVLFLVYMDSFRRLVPERYVGEGSFKFAPQLVSGELQWHYLLDNDCNQWGDYGWHKYQITRAYQPVRPMHVIPVLYRRCKADLGLEDCVTTTCPVIGAL